MNPQQVLQLQKILVSQGYLKQEDMNTGPGIYGPKTTAAMQKAVASSLGDVAKNVPGIQGIIKTNGAEGIVNAYSSGDWSSIVDGTGTPFSPQQQQEALTKAEADLAPYYAAQKQYDTQNAEDLLRKQQLDYQNSQANDAAQFQEDKTKLDQTAADQGVLFSGGRVQKEKNLGMAYTQNQAYNQASTANAIGNTARDYQYKYGNDAANNLSQYYRLGGNTYNPNMATGGVGSSGLSSVYNTGNSNFQGTQVNTAKAEAQKRAAGLLWNRSNKLVGGYKNKY